MILSIVAVVAPLLIVAVLAYGVWTDWYLPRREALRARSREAHQRTYEAWRAHITQDFR